MRQIVLDTETTGIQVPEHRIIEIGCLELINRKLTGKQFQKYVNPERPVDAGAVAVHGITDAFLKDKPRFVDIVDEFMAFIDGAELIIHNAPFDISFINHELKLTQKKFKPVSDYCQILDTLPMARQKHPGQRNSLDALCKRYGVDNSKREFHGALLDVYLLTQVYLNMTGGQGHFFDALSHQSNTSNTSMENRVTSARSYQLTVLKADENELKEHHDYIEKLKKSGQCQWPEDKNS